MNKEKLEPQILYEDDDLLVLNKPAGLVVHGDGRSEEPTLVDWLLRHYPSIENVGEPPIPLSDKYKQQAITRPGIVHRLDKETSGALVVAKTEKAFQFLKSQFQNREVEKKYHVFVWGEVKKDRDSIDRPIGRSASDFRKWSAQRGAKGELREALTEYRVLGRHDGISFVEARPKTGRTHQIRVHFKAINYPVVADRLYAPKQGTALGFERTALHAYSVKFKNLKGEWLEIIAPYPADFKKAVDSVKESTAAENQ